MNIRELMEPWTFDDLMFSDAKREWIADVSLQKLDSHTDTLAAFVHYEIEPYYLFYFEKYTIEKGWETTCCSTPESEHWEEILAHFNLIEKYNEHRLGLL